MPDSINKLRGLHGTCCQYDAALGTQFTQLRSNATDNSGGAAVLNNNARNMRAGENLKVVAPFGLAQIGVGGTHPPAVARRQLVVTDAFLTRCR